MMQSIRKNALKKLYEKQSVCENA